jgi:hypothetical protein
LLCINNAWSHHHLSAFSQPAPKREEAQNLEEEKLENDFADVEFEAVGIHAELLDDDLAFVVVTVDCVRWAGMGGLLETLQTAAKIRLVTKQCPFCWVGRLTRQVPRENI